jgi:hypothetical protein
LRSLHDTVDVLDLADAEVLAIEIRRKPAARGLGEVQR